MLNNLKPSSFPHLPHPKVHSSAERLLNRQFVQYQDLRYRRLADLCGYLSTFFLLVCVVQIFFSVAPGEIVMTVLQCLVLYSFCWHFTAVRDQHISWLKSQPKLEFLWTLEKLEADRHEHLAMCYKEIAV